LEDYLYQSERLGFRNWQEQDLVPFTKMNENAEVMEFFPTTLAINQSNDLVETFKNHFIEHGFTFYATCLLTTHKFIGFIGFIGLKIISKTFDFACGVEIGWRLDNHYWGKGYATEGARIILAIAPSLGIKSVHSLTAVINKRSEQVMIKCGMNHVGYFEHPLVDIKSDLRKHTLYKIDLK